MVGRPEWCVVIVHGTWAHKNYSAKAKVINHNLTQINDTKGDSEWFEAHSSFAAKLYTKLNQCGVVVSLDSCIWSGRNSLNDREETSDFLAAHIVNLHGRYPSSRIVIVAHSHGGNVVISSLNKVPFRSYVDVVTLGTPFLTIYPPRISRPKISRLIMWWSSLSSGALLLNVVFAIALAWSSALIFAATCGCIFSVYFQLKVIHKNNNSISDNVLRMSKITSTKGLEGNQSRLLVLRGINDEAGAAISFAAASSMLSKLISDKCLIGLIYLPFVAAAMGILAVAAVLFGIHGSEIVIDKAPGWGIIGLSVLLAMIGLGILFAAFCNVAYARELCLRFYDIEISLNSVPDFDGEIVIHTITRGNSETFKMRHALYTDEGFLERMAAWLTT